MKLVWLIKVSNCNWYLASVVFIIEVTNLSLHSLPNLLPFLIVLVLWVTILCGWIIKVRRSRPDPSLIWRALGLSLRSLKLLVLLFDSIKLLVPSPTQFYQVRGATNKCWLRRAAHSCTLREVALVSIHAFTDRLTLCNFVIYGWTCLIILLYWQLSQTSSNLAHKSRLFAPRVLSTFVWRIVAAWSHFILLAFLGAARGCLFLDGMWPNK